MNKDLIYGTHKKSVPPVVVVALIAGSIGYFLAPAGSTL
jgi:hypothetical protein